MSVETILITKIQNNMKSLLTTLQTMMVLSLMTVTLSAQEKDTRQVGDFDGVKVSSGIKAELVRGSTTKVEITASGIDIDKVTTEVKNGVLKVGIDNNWWNSLRNKKRKVEATITYSGDLSQIAAGSGSRIECDHTIQSKSLDIDVSSGASMDVEIEVSDATIDISSGASLNLAGEASSTEIDISSGASLSGYDFATDMVDIDGSSGATARIHVVKELVADVSSGASVKYKGNPTKRDIDKGSGGSVRPQ